MLQPVKRGFTLIELMIVMFIIGILLALVIPAFKGNNEEGKPNQPTQGRQSK